MNLQKHIDPATGLVALRLKDGTAVKRWPIDAREMLAGGATLGDPHAAAPTPPAQRPRMPEPEPDIDE